MRYWLFYAGPENYLSEQGERDFTNIEVVWSSVPDVAKGDQVLLYRKSLSDWSLNTMVELTGMSIKKAQELKRKGIGSDIPSVWEVVSGNLGCLGKWQTSCAVRHQANINPPIKLRDLKADLRLKRWQDLRWNFQAQGRDAIEIPEFAWVIIKEMISSRIGPTQPS